MMTEASDEDGKRRTTNVMFTPRQKKNDGPMFPSLVTGGRIPDQDSEAVRWIKTTVFLWFQHRVHMDREKQLKQQETVDRTILLGMEERCG